MAERHQSPKALLRIGIRAAEKAMSGKRPGPRTFRAGVNAAAKAIQIADPQAGTSTHRYRTMRYSHGLYGLAKRATTLARRLLWMPHSHRPAWDVRVDQRSVARGLPAASSAPPGPSSGFGRERTTADLRARIAWERWAAREQRRLGHEALADGHDLARVAYEARLNTSGRSRSRRR